MAVARSQVLIIVLLSVSYGFIMPAFLDAIPPGGPSHNKWCVKSHLFLEHFKSVPDGAFSNRVVLGIECVGAESLGPFLRLNSGMAHVDVGPPVPARTPASSAV